jgi:hypothetical protein
MTMNPEHADLHRLVDRLDPDQVRALRAVARQLLRPHVEQPGSGEAQAVGAESLLADEPVRDFPRPASRVRTTLLRRFRGPIIVPAPIVTEVAYFLQSELGPAVKAAFLGALARGGLIVKAPPRDRRRTVRLGRLFGESGIGPTMP